MKKILTAGIGALLVCAAGTLVNYLHYRQDHHLLWCYRIHGGEITIEYGFAVKAVHIYAMTPEQVGTHHISFSILGLIVSLLVSFAILLLLITLIGKLLKR